MARLTVAAAGNATENINLINPRFMAEALRRLRGYDIGVLDNSFFSSSDTTGISRVENADFMWKITASNVTDIAVGRGMATAYGYDIQSEDTVHLTATAPSVGIKYIFVYLEWNFGNQIEAIGSINVCDNGNSGNWTPSRQDNLITNPYGTYQMPIYRLAINTYGQVTDIKSWEDLGVRTIGDPAQSDHAVRAENADSADNASAVAGEAATLVGGVLSLGGKQVLRRKALFTGNQIFYSDSSVDETLTLSENIQSGDLLMVEYDPWYIASAYDYLHRIAVDFIKVGRVNTVHGTYGIQLFSINGHWQSSGGFDLTSNTFFIKDNANSGNILVYKGGYRLTIGLSNGTNASVEETGTAIKAIYKIYA